ncbi:MAG: UbiD family decarboxylase [Gammaproteobacteria bacterium]|nr:UbiD family decarboxylase [Gammaproteobacteria bacterium]MDE0414138.1 UbiD family decarboxylase [Gammaproteobacteria bacterium]
MSVFNSLREYAQAMEQQGKLLRIPDMDQDQFEMTAFSYRLEDRMRTSAPAFLVERTKMNGRWYDTPVICNVLNSFKTVAMCLGVTDLSDDEREMNQVVERELLKHMNEDYRFEQIPPVEVDGADAPCKEVKLFGEDADLDRFPWIMNNPADGGRFISTGSVIMEDPEIGRNVGTYRLQVKGPQKLGICFTGQNHGAQMMRKAIAQGKKSVPCVVATGLDPITWMMSSTRVGELGDDEFAFSGGFRGEPVELVRAETNALMAPAHAEIVIEGEISTDKEMEGPYGEMLGYIGEPAPNHFMTVKAITHREKPWVYNIWPGIGGAYLTWPWQVGHFARLKRIMPNLVKLHMPPEIPSMVIACINKRLPGEGIEAGLLIMGYRMIGFSKKMIIILDKDVDPTDITRVLHAVTTRWQPWPASLTVRQTFSFMIDPSTQRNALSSKILIDATRQLPAEGGPNVFAEDNRTVMEERAADSFKLVDRRWDEYFSN